MNALFTAVTDPVCDPEIFQLAAEKSSSIPGLETNDQERRIARVDSRLVGPLDAARLTAKTFVAVQQNFSIATVGVL